VEEVSLEEVTLGVIRTFHPTRQPGEFPQAFDRFPPNGIYSRGDPGGAEVFQILRGFSSLLARPEINRRCPLSETATPLKLRKFFLFDASGIKPRWNPPPGKHRMPEGLFGLLEFIHSGQGEATAAYLHYMHQCNEQRSGLARARNFRPGRSSPKSQGELFKANFLPG